MPLEAELKAFVGLPTWLLGTKLYSSGRAESALKIFVVIFLSSETSLSYRSIFIPPCNSPGAVSLAVTHSMV